MSILCCTIDQVNIVSAITGPQKQPLGVGMYTGDQGTYFATIAEVGAPSYEQAFNRDLTVAFDGTSWWFGFAFWLTFNSTPVALTNVGPKQQISLTAYTQGNAQTNQIWGMQNIHEISGTNYVHIPTYNSNSANSLVMDLFNGDPEPGTWVQTFPINGGNNQYWRFEVLSS